MEMPEEPFEKLGTPRVLADECSRCGADLSEIDYMPLILRAWDKQRMWVYCEACAKIMWDIIPRRKQ
jgi:hypothetical protein